MFLLQSSFCILLCKLICERSSLEMFLSRHATPIYFFVHYCKFLSLVPMTVFLWTPVQHCASTITRIVCLSMYWILSAMCECEWLANMFIPFFPNDLPSPRIHNFRLEVMKVSFLRMQSLSIWDCSVTSCLLHYATNSQCLVRDTSKFETLEKTTATDVLEQIKASMSLLPPATQVSQQTLEYIQTFFQLIHSARVVQCWFRICPSGSSIWEPIGIRLFSSSKTF